MTVLGLGRIGESIARKATGFDMTVYGVKRHPDTYEGSLPDERVMSPESLQTILPQTDVLVVIVPLTDDTYHLISTEVFRELPGSAILINVARGSVVDENALIEALRNGSIAAAGLDVFESEPLPAESPLWERDDVLVTPHVAGRSERFGERFSSLFFDNYDRWKNGMTLRNVVGEPNS
jgi:D-2-hydroxyacid dehydrogenase (NADP+)